MLLLVRARPNFHLCSFLSRFNCSWSWTEHAHRNQTRLFLREEKTRGSLETIRRERKEREKMSHDMAVTFLGTSSGGGPCDTRSCSSVALDLLGNGDLWLVDCAEGTLRQFMLQPERFGPRRLKTNRITKIFITHLHFDHCMGIITLLANMLRGGAGAEQPPRSKPPLVELYGPAGLRTFVRSILKMTMTELTERYCVHELLTPSDARTSCDAFNMHPGESAGKNIVSVSTGLWFDLAVEGSIHVDAAPIIHRAPCLGYVFREIDHLARKVVILGDTCDASPIANLAQNASLLIHEATDAHIPVEIDRNLRGDKKTPEMVEKRTIEKGHSTPAMAGVFARAINAQRLVLNHFSGKFPAPFPHRRDRRRLVMNEIERQASEAWGQGSKAIAAYDYMRIDLPGAPVQSRFKEPLMEPSETSENGQEVDHEKDLDAGLRKQYHRGLPTFQRSGLGQGSGPARKVLKRRKTGEKEREKDMHFSK